MAGCITRFIKIVFTTIIWTKL